MSFGSTLRRFNPLKADLVALSEPPFDPRKQSWVAGALAAVETFVGAVLALPFLAAVWACAWFASMSPSERQTHHFHHVNAWSFSLLGTCSVVAAAFLWAGLALMFGWRSRYRAQGTLVLVVLLSVCARSIALAVMAP